MQSMTYCRCSLWPIWVDAVYDLCSLWPMQSMTYAVYDLSSSCTRPPEWINQAHVLPKVATGKKKGTGALLSAVLQTSSSMIDCWSSVISHWSSMISHWSEVVAELFDKMGHNISMRTYAIRVRSTWWCAPVLTPWLLLIHQLTPVLTSWLLLIHQCAAWRVKRWPNFHKLLNPPPSSIMCTLSLRIRQRQRPSSL